MSTGASTKDFASRLDQTADDTEAVLTKVLADGVLPDEIARPKRLMDAMRYYPLDWTTFERHRGASHEKVFDELRHLVTAVSQ